MQRTIKSPLTLRAYEHIHAQIFSGELGVGSVVSEVSLAKTLGISRTPVGDAIRQLQFEGLVEQVPRFGTVVRSPDRYEIAELFEMREALEGHAAAKAAQHIGPEDLELLRHTCEEMRSVACDHRTSGQATLSSELLRRFLSADLAFHTIILRAAGNRHIMQVVGQFRVISRIFGRRRRIDHNLHIVSRAYLFHRRILRAIQQGNTAMARDTMARHIALSKHQTLQALEGGEQGRGQSDPIGLPPSLLKEFEAFRSLHAASHPS